MQHASLTSERWAQIPLEQQILMIANEMNRAGKLFGAGDRGRLGTCYERILRLVDLTVETRNRPALRRELLRWRDLVAALYLALAPDREKHRAAFRALLLLHPVSAQQIPFVLSGEAAASS
jgi:hypothetical protein